MVAWSLSIEEIFYLIFPLYLISLSKFDLSKITVFFIIFLIIIKVVSFENFSPNFLRTGSILRLDAIALGFLVALHHDKFLMYKNSIFLIFIVSGFIIFNLNLISFGDNLQTLIFILLFL